MNLANRLTIARVLLVPIMLAFCLVDRSWAWTVAGSVFVLASVTDFFDGWVARTRHEVSTFGKLVDPLADKVLVISALLMLNGALQYGTPLLSVWVTLVTVVREFVVSGVRMMAAAQNQTVISASWLGKLKTIVQCVGVPFIMIGHGNLPVFFWLDTVTIGQWLLVISAVLAVVSGVEYVVLNTKFLRDQDPEPKEEPEGEQIPFDLP